MNKGLALCAGIGLAVAGPFGLIVASSGETGPQVPAAARPGLDLRLIPTQYQSWIQAAAKTCGTVTGPVLAAQIDAESSWNPMARSGAGAEGLSQFTPSTWAAWSVNANPLKDATADPFDPADAIMTQAGYDCALASKVQQLIDGRRVTGDPVSLTLAAYNAGIDAVETYHGLPPYPETEKYVAGILAKIPSYAAPPRSTDGQSAFGARVVAAAMSYQGTPYSWGGGSIAGPTYGVGEGAHTQGFDCSGLVMYAVYQASGGRVVLPHSSEEQAALGHPVNPNEIEVGDVIAFQLAPGDYDHIGIYVGHGQFVQAPKTGDVVRVGTLSDPYYAGKTITVRRFG